MQNNTYLLTVADEPVKIYQCESCPKTFVRSDLLFRHKDRHARRSSKQSSGSASRYKSIRPARSDSLSSREDSGLTQPSVADPAPSTNMQMTDRNSQYVQSPTYHMSQAIPLPQSMLQPSYPFPNSTLVNGLSSSFEEYAVRHRTNTLPSPINIIQPPHQSPEFDCASQLNSIPDSSNLPPIHPNHVIKPRTYSVESILNERDSKECSAVRDSAIEE